MEEVEVLPKQDSDDEGVVGQAIRTTASVLWPTLASWRRELTAGANGEQAPPQAELWIAVTLAVGQQLVSS